MKTILLVGLGGGLGSIFRYLTSVFVNRFFQSSFPFGTLAVNVVGCLIAGIVLGVLERKGLAGGSLKIFLITGFCGGYTTFSAFASESLQLLLSGNSFYAFAYVGASVLVGLVAVWLGLFLAGTWQL